MNKDIYNILGVKPGCTLKEAKDAYRKMAHKYHPDKGGDPVQFKALQEAYEIISDPEKRRHYDFLHTNQSTSSSTYTRASAPKYKPASPKSKPGVQKRSSPIIQNFGKVFAVSTFIFVFCVVIYLLMTNGANREIASSNQGTTSAPTINGNSNIPLANPEDDNKELLNKIGLLIDLPSNETPTIATVTDLSKLKDQTFFDKALLGDKVLIYSYSRKAILYRPDTNRVINIAPLSKDTDISSIENDDPLDLFADDKTKNTEQDETAPEEVVPTKEFQTMAYVEWVSDPITTYQCSSQNIQSASQQQSNVYISAGFLEKANNLRNSVYPGSPQHQSYQEAYKGSVHSYNISVMSFNNFLKHNCSLI